MATTPLIEVADITAVSGDVFAYDSPELRQVEFFIRFASGKARRGVRKASSLDLDQGLADGTVDRDLMIGTMAVVVLRALSTWRQGLGVKSRQFLEESTEYSEAEGASSLVYFTDDEIDSLTPVQTAVSRSGAFSIRVGDV